ncbi:MAG: hypothetical protein AVO39_09045 [delta proteobacterium MLS_D]|nr:MAG: hypothetical protein AVO39_09045 [delta proteobacterium MLS_D]
MSSIPATALSALGTAMNVIAHNTANVSTDGFEKSRARFLETRAGGVTVSIEGSDERTFCTYPDHPAVTEPESSNVDLHEEFGRLITTLHAYEAVVATVREENETKRILMDVIV